ncbi:MAG: hypothetical protein IIB54_03320 [Planctomycetes bacterium]|nr:hypothetical protein [Planctomycetota bacterium]
MNSRFLLILISGFLSWAQGAQAVQEQALAPPEEQAPVHWATKLGLRALQAELSCPLTDRVVLVPDGATYLDELSKWSLDGRWPVLIEDDFLTPMFLRRFRPAEIILRDSVGEWKGNVTGKRAVLEAIVIGAWGGDPDSQSTTETLAALGYSPPGVIVTSVHDPAWTAAVALAAGRGQLLLWLDGQYGTPNATLGDERARQLRKKVEDLIIETGLPYQDIGDAIDTLTICRSMAGKVGLQLPNDQRVPAPEKYREGPVALTDYLSRREDWSRYAFTGWIFGSEVRCAYVAMCSLFLPRESIALINTYPDQGNWKAYAMGKAAESLHEQGFDVLHTQGTAASRVAWMESLAGGFGRDVLIMNSKGNAGDFHLSDTVAMAIDVPLCAVPTVVHFTHSWAMRAPANSATVAGRWLDHGAYAFVGSVHEPLLSAFVPPERLAGRLIGMAPLLVACRWWVEDGILARPWRVNTFGDPLMTFPSPKIVKRQRIQQPAAYGTKLADHTRTLMGLIQAKPSGDVYREAVKSLVLLGRDDLAIQLWRMAAQQEVGDHAAEAVLGSLFRAGLSDDFLEAWKHVSEPQERERDMLWHLMESRVTPGIKADLLEILLLALRRSMPHEDVKRLAPYVDRIFGRRSVQELITRELERSPQADVERALNRLLKQYP